MLYERMKWDNGKWVEENKKCFKNNISIIVNGILMLRFGGGEG